MEMIGVMAVVSILAATLAPTIFKTIDKAFGDAETNNINLLGEALQQSILDNQQIPNQNINNWVAAIAAYSDLANNDIEFNARGYRRRLYVDPRFFTNSDSVFPGYTQNTGLTQAPFSPRLMLVSDLTRNSPAPPTTNVDFDDIWNQNPGAGVVEGDEVKIKRLHLAGFFHRLILVNANTQQAAYSLEGAANNPVPQAVGAVDGSLTVYVIENTQINLFANPFPTGALNTVSMVNADSSYRFDTNGSNWLWKSQ